MVSFDEIIEQAPRLADQAGQLCQEHVQLMEAMDQLNQLAGTQTGSAEWWQQLADRFHLLSKDLMHHEHKENELLQDAYENDIGSKD